MENIIRQLVSSKRFSENLKLVLLSEIFKNLDIELMNLTEYSAVLKIFVEWILDDSEEKSLSQLGLDQFSRFANTSLTKFCFVATPCFVLELFKRKMSNKIGLIKISDIVTCALYRNHAEFDDLTKLNDNARSLRNIIEGCLIGVIRNETTKAQIPLINSLAELYTKNPQVLPSSVVDCSKLAILTMGGLVSLSFDSSEENSSFKALLSCIWTSKSQNSEQILNNVLQIFYRLISEYVDDYSLGPNATLMGFIDTIPLSHMENTTKVIIETECSSLFGEKRLINAITLMMYWLTTEGNSEKTCLWVLHIMQQLQMSKKFNVLIQIANKSGEKLIACILSKSSLDNESTDIYRWHILPLVSFLLIGYQHSVELFRRVYSYVQPLLKFISVHLSQNCNQDQRIDMNIFVESVAFLINRVFPPLEDIDKLPQHAIEQCRQLLSDPFLVETSSLTPDRIKEFFSQAWLVVTDPILDSKLVKFNDPVVDEVTGIEQERLETGMTGLVNLGNTCYMNSVIQALFITHEFQCIILQKQPRREKRPIGFELQKVFAFLKYTQRVTFTPADFLISAKPPWFEEGRQQDCSEFLRYLLNTLDEEEQEDICLIDTVLGTSPLSFSLSTNPIMEVDEHLDSVECQINTPPTVQDMPNLVSKQGSHGTMDYDDFAEVSSGVECDSYGMCRLEDFDDEIKRWSTKENLCHNEVEDGSSKTLIKSLDVTAGLESSDSGIQSARDSIHGSMKDDSETEDSAESHFQVDETSKSLVRDIFGGKMEITYECTTCGSRSLHIESFIDLHLAFPEITCTKTLTESNVLPKAENNSQSKTDPIDAEAITETHSLSMQSLVDNYLKSECLEGENQYYCNCCDCLRDAIKKVRIIEYPRYLLATLMRFYYDREMLQRQKIFTNVQESETITFSVEDSNFCYELYAAIVHSGYSSEGGHYYTLSIPPSSAASWLSFNDSYVTKVDLKTFNDLSTQFPRDTPYVLLYRQRGSLSNIDSCEDSLHPTLRLLVDRDNDLYQQEKRRITENNGKNGNSFQKSTPPPPPPPPSGGCGEEAQFLVSPSNFIC